LSYIQNKILVR